MAQTESIRVMIVEDQLAYQELVQVVLSLDPRFDVVSVCDNGEAAVKAFDEASPDLVLLDFRMPGIDGLETAKRMKERRPEVTIAMVTAHTAEVLSRLAREARIQEVIPKANFSLERVQKLAEGIV